MATTLLSGQRTWSLVIDENGHYEYSIKHLVKAAYTDGPTNVINTAGLPQPGSSWSFDSDVNPNAYCRPNARVNIHTENEGEKSRYWIVEQTFSTKPLNRCGDNPVTDPLLEPQKVSGSSVKYTEEATEDRFGLPIKNSAHEQMRGPQVEFDHNRDSITIEQNVASLDYAVFSVMRDTLNDDTLWGFPPRCIKLSSVSWEKKYYGECAVYYVRKFTFDISIKTDPDTGEPISGFDRDLLDEAGSVLKGHWSSVTGEWELDDIGGEPPDPGNPSHFITAKDRHGENKRFILNGAGIPITIKTLGAVENGINATPIQITSTKHGLTTGDEIVISEVEGLTAANDEWVITVVDVDNFTLNGSVGNDVYTQGGLWRKLKVVVAGKIHVEKYDESNFLLLGIPTSI